jgi:HD-GYP domain
MDQLVSSLSHGLDGIEKEAFGVTSNHGRRIALLALAMGRRLGWQEEDLIGLGACALLHDNALTEYFLSERPGNAHSMNMKPHCIKGEENAACLPLPASAKGVILYHHEHRDGSGAFGLNAAEETPVGAQLIAVADALDSRMDLRMPDENSIPLLKAYVEKNRGTFFTVVAADALLSVLDSDLLCRLCDENLDRAFAEAMPKWEVALRPAEMMHLGKIVARITDYKSAFTAKHSAQIANRAHLMARYYGMDDETCAKVYLAASLHDLGKLLTPLGILEKPGKLTPDEYAVIQDHVYWSYIMLKDVEGFEKLCRWAVAHHRKLDGGGYPELPGNFFPLDFISRLMACVDIYQAVRETRPYHAGRTHRETMEILWEMAGKGEIDEQITQDLDTQMAVFTEDDGDVPDPALSLAPCNA